jgi:nucleoside-diphosphate-sugar epimerase
MARIVVTGSGGTIGVLLMNGLSNQDLTGLDLPDADIRDIDVLRQACSGQDVVIHLAGDFRREHHRSRHIDPDNVTMDVNVINAVADTGVPRLILASSVHTDAYLTHTGPALLTTATVGVPTSPYGARKLLVEALGRHLAARRPVEVIAIRFGGVGTDDRRAPGGEGAVLLRRQDCLTCVQAVLGTTPNPSRYACFYAVSDNPDRVHDLSNPFNWQPERR